MCQEEEMLKYDPTLQVLIAVGSDSNARQYLPVKPLTCGMPALLVDVYCKGSQEAQKSGTLDIPAIETEVKSLLEIVERKNVANRNLPRCDNNPSSAILAPFFNAMKNFYDHLLDYELGLVNDLIIAFKLDVPEMPNNPDRIWFRQSYRMYRANQENVYASSSKEETPERDPMTNYVYPSLHWGRLKKTLKTVFLPYAHSNEGFLYDCFGYKLDE